MNSSLKPKARDPYFDFLRGIAIIFVVGIHTVCGANFETVSGNIAVFIRQAIGCAVPLFLAISGYFLSKKSFTNRFEFFCFFKKQSLKIYIPTLIYSIPWLILTIHKGGNPFFSLILFFACGMSIYYFIALIIQYYLLLPILQKVKFGGVCLSILTSLITVSIICYLLFFKNLHIPLIFYAGPFPTWIMFFVVGCYIGKRNVVVNSSLLIICFIISLIYCYFESRYIYIYI